MGLSGINPSFPGLFRCRGQVIHVLLTRSPLSPGPKSWFSLDLHVLGAPPAFVLSQDQTLREETKCRSEDRRTGCLPSSLPSSAPEGASRGSQKASDLDPTGSGELEVDGIDDIDLLSPASRTGADEIASRRTRTLLSFQRPIPSGDGAASRRAVHLLLPSGRQRKASDSRQRPSIERDELVVSDSVEGAPGVAGRSSPPLRAAGGL